jgi:imidazoleglycerol-phosphate dehydratase
MSRIGKVSRKTKESDVSVEINLDGTGNVSIETGVPFYDHMLSQLGKHAAFDLKIKTIGDVVVDEHHTIEDTAISLGQAFKESLGDKSGIKRYGDATLPLDEVLVRAAVDLSGRPYLVHHETEIDTTLTKHIWESFVNSSDITLHIKVLEGRNAHHVVEAQFKAVARALREAVSLDAKSVGIPSTKGVL